MRLTDSEDTWHLYRSVEEAMKRADREGGTRRYPRRLVLRAATLAAVGGASALPALLAACGGGSKSPTTSSKSTGSAVSTSNGPDITASNNLTPIPEGQFKYSRYPLVDKYNWRYLPWGGTPTQGGNLVANPLQPPNWNPLQQISMDNYGGRLWSTLGRILYGPNVDMHRVPDRARGKVRQSAAGQRP
jgi:hypothetical protein